jgi:hypothetical protein
MGCLVVVLGDSFEPCRGAALVVFDQGQMAHQAVPRSTVPVFLPCGGVDGVSGPQEDDLPVTVSDESQAVCAVQCLAKWVGVPVCAGSGRETDHGGYQS